MRLYLDTSALVKLVRREVETDALRAFLAKHLNDPRVTSELTRTELIRAVQAHGVAALDRARATLEEMDQIAMRRSLLDSAANLPNDPPLGTLDAIHLATALTLGRDLRTVVTYDRRMVSAAESLGLRVESPS